ncbi:MAG TPA: hypothetical protein VIY08_03760 [Candidatus Nitrosocosmicus sp.]
MPINRSEKIITIEIRKIDTFGIKCPRILFFLKVNNINKKKLNKLIEKRFLNKSHEILNAPSWNMTKTVKIKLLL